MLIVREILFTTNSCERAKGLKIAKKVQVIEISSRLSLICIMSIHDYFIIGVDQVLRVSGVCPTVERSGGSIKHVIRMPATRDYFMSEVVGYFMASLLLRRACCESSGSEVEYHKLIMQVKS